MIRIPVTETKIEKVYPPSELLRACEGPDLDTLDTTGDIERALIKSGAALKACNEDKEAIRIWQETN